MRPPINPWGDRGRRTVGVLGGSFNPAHDGHRHISLAALKLLGLDEVWWLVSPQNPLKDTSGMATLAERLASARAVSANPRLRPCSLEQSWGSRFTIDAIGQLRRRFPRTRFVWLMGADNLVQIPRWRRWRAIFRSVPVAIFARGSYSFPALAGKAARRFGSARLRTAAARTLAGRRPPAWVFLAIRKHPASATDIRARRKAPLFQEL